jgi:hypothetical protein
MNLLVVAFGTLLVTLPAFAEDSEIVLRPKDFAFSVRVPVEKAAEPTREGRCTTWRLGSPDKTQFGVHVWNKDSDMARLYDPEYLLQQEALAFITDSRTHQSRPGSAISQVTINGHHGTEAVCPTFGDDRAARALFFETPKCRYQFASSYLKTLKSSNDIFFDSIDFDEKPFQTWTKMELPDSHISVLFPTIHNADHDNGRSEWSRFGRVHGLWYLVKSETLSHANESPE